MDFRINSKLDFGLHVCVLGPWVPKDSSAANFSDVNENCKAAVCSFWQHLHRTMERALELFDLTYPLPISNHILFAQRKRSWIASRWYLKIPEGACISCMRKLCWVEMQQMNLDEWIGGNMSRWLFSGVEKDIYKKLWVTPFRAFGIFC